MSGPRALVVRVDGEAMPEPEARAFWERFSAWMEEHKGDLGGFAASEGFASVHPGVEDGRPVLVASRKDPQRAYAPVNARGTPGGGGSPTRPSRPHGDHRRRDKSHDSKGKARS